jgi:hypothetical protein
VTADGAPQPDQAKTVAPRSALAAARCARGRSSRGAAASGPVTHGPQRRRQGAAEEAAERYIRRWRDRDGDGCSCGKPFRWNSDRLDQDEAGRLPEKRSPTSIKARADMTDQVPGTGQPLQINVDPQHRQDQAVPARDVVLDERGTYGSTASRRCRATGDARHDRASHTSMRGTP